MYVKLPLALEINLKGQYHAIFSNTSKIEKTLFGSVIAAKIY